MTGFLPPLIQGAAGVCLLAFLAVLFAAQTALRAPGGRYFATAMLLIPAGFVVIAQATQSATLDAAMPLLLTGGGAIVLSSIVTGVGLFTMARGTSADAGRAS